jgi:hypothetical protein
LTPNAATATPIFIDTEIVAPTGVPVLPAQTTSTPTTSPSGSPSTEPASSPSEKPTAAPFETPSGTPSLDPSSKPTALPSLEPSSIPTTAPSIEPSSAPSSTPSLEPSETPSTVPSTEPTTAPSTEPSQTPTTVPSSAPTTMPSLTPTVVPTTAPSSEPSVIPTSTPSTEPSAVPSKAPVVSVPVVPVRVVPDSAPVPILTAVPIPVKIINFTFPEIFIDSGNDTEDLPYISGRHWSSSFGHEISGIPIEYQNVSDAFQSHRSGSNFAYTIARLLPYSSYEVILGFAENFIDYCVTGARVFNVTVNGKPFVTEFDVFDTVGCDNAIVVRKVYRANGDGQLVIRFIPIKTHPFVAMIGINSKGPIKKVVLCTAVNQTEIMALGNNDTIDLGAIGTNQLSIRADTIEQITRVRFRYNGKVHTEHSVPYVINGDNGTNYYAEPYLAKNGNKTIWMDTFDEDNKASGTIRLDLLVVGDEDFIVEEVGEPEVIDDAPTTSSPSSSPSDRPSSIPSDTPSSLPSDVPSDAPSSMPSDTPSALPSDTPSALPSSTPSTKPSDTPSTAPTVHPTDKPTDAPSTSPTSGQPVV